MQVEASDFLIAADLPYNPMAGKQELFNIIKAKGIKHLVYMGVHENMCIMGRPFAIHEMTKLGFTAENIAVVPYGF